MNPAIKRLQEAERSHVLAVSPKFGAKYHYPTKYSDKSANGLTRCITDWLKFNGWQGERISNTGRMKDGRKTYVDSMGFFRQIGSVEWIPGSGTKGTADISATIKGRSVKIEVKIGRDRQSAAQKKYQESIERSGGVYIIARTFEGFLDWYDKFING